MHSHRVVQIGHTNDEAIPCHIDLRGRTTLRQLAAVLAHSRLFVGLIGMPMHLARAVECPSVILYGGRERPEQSGYSCNFNIFSDIECAPSWRDNRCELRERRVHEHDRRGLRYRGGPGYARSAAPSVNN